MTDGATRHPPGLDGVTLDRRVEATVRRLNSIPGSRTRASCQGKTPEEIATHADLAYVLFEEPMPLSLEDHLVRNLSGLARIEPDGVYARWPDRNRELCAALEHAVEAHRRLVASERWALASMSCAALDAHLASHLAGEAEVALVWCASCATVDDARHDGHGPVVALAERAATAQPSILRDFLERDPHPLDLRIREREGDAAILARLLRGAFGTDYREAWRRHAGMSAVAHRRTDLRDLVRRAASPDASTDFYVSDGAVFFAARR